MHLAPQAVKLAVQLETHVIGAAFALKAFLQTDHAYTKEVSDQTRRVVNHITSTNLDLAASAATTSRRDTRNSESAEPIAFPSKWVISRQSLFKKAVTKFETDIENFRQRYFQPRAETPPSADSTPSEKKLSPPALRPPSRFLENVYSKPSRGRSRSQSTSANPLDLSPVPEVKGRRDPSVAHKQNKQPNIFEVIDPPSTSEGRPRSESVFAPSTETSAEKIIYDHPIGPQLENMTPPIEDAAIQTTVNAAINRNLKNMMNKIQEMISNTQRGPQDLQRIQGSQDEQETQENSDINVVSDFENRWHAGDVDFFDSYYEGKFFFSDSTLKYADKDIIFQNVHVFIDRAKNVTENKEWKIVRNNLSTCLKEQTLIWYIFEFTDDIRRLLKYDDQLKK